MKLPAQPKVSGREARRRLTVLQTQTEEAVIPGIGVLVQASNAQLARIDALEKRPNPETCWARLKWLAGW